VPALVWAKPDSVISNRCWSVLKRWPQQSLLQKQWAGKGR
jgi:hypothetical protein